MAEEFSFPPPPPSYTRKRPSQFITSMSPFTRRREDPPTPFLPTHTCQANDRRQGDRPISPSQIKRQGSYRLLPHHQIWSLIDEWWLWELMSWTFAAICTTIIIILLAIYEGEALPQWPLGLTINAYVSVLGAFAKAGLLLPTAEALGQLKFNWFASASRDIQDFQTFDQASRGPWGSLVLILKTRGRALAALGAAIMVLSIAMDPFLQQIVIYPSRLIPSSEAWISRATMYTAMDEGSWLTVNGTGYSLPDLAMKYYVQPMLYSKAPTVKPTIPSVCSTGSCSFPPYETLAVCSSCSDISHLLEHTCLKSPMDWISNVTDGTMSAKKYGYADTCGWYLNATSDFPALMSGYGTEHLVNETLLSRTLSLNIPVNSFDFYNRSILYRNISQPINDFVVVAAPNGFDSVRRGEPPIAKECVLSWCVQTVKTEIVNNTWTEEVLDVYQGTPMATNPWNATYYPEGMYVEYNYMAETLIKPPHSNITFGLTSNQTAFEVGQLFVNGGSSFITTKDETSVPQMRYDWNDAQGLLQVPLSPWVGPGIDIPTYIDDMAKAMTGVLRSAKNGTEMMKGTAMAPQTYVRVRWAWLAFPLALLMLSLAFLLAAIFQSRSNGVDVWKTSALAVLMHGMTRDASPPDSFTPKRDAGVTIDEVSNVMEDCDSHVRRVKIHLHKRRGHWRFSKRLSRQ